jgi:hypothetical protein
LQNVPEIYLTLVVFVGLIIVGTANFTPSAYRVVQKKEITLSLYEFVRTSLLIVFCLYLIQMLSVLKVTAIIFNAHSIVDLYTQTLKLIILLTT